MPCSEEVVIFTPDECARVDGHPAAKRRLLEPHRDARRLAPDRTPTPMAADSKPKSKGASPAQGLTTPALDWSPGNTFDVTPGMPRHICLTPAL